jgi:hypothetical protein
VSDSYVFRLTQPDLHYMYWVAVGLVALLWPLALWRLLPLARRALLRGQIGCCLSALTVAICPALLGHAVATSLHEDSLRFIIDGRTAEVRSVLGSHWVSLDRPLSFRCGQQEITVSDGVDHFVLPAGRTWRLQYARYETDSLVRELQARSPDPNEWAHR